MLGRLGTEARTVAACPDGGTGCPGLGFRSGVAGWATGLGYWSGLLVWATGLGYWAGVSRWSIGLPTRARVLGRG